MNEVRLCTYLIFLYFLEVIAKRTDLAEPISRQTNRIDVLLICAIICRVSIGDPTNYCTLQPISPEQLEVDIL